MDFEHAAIDIDLTSLDHGHGDMSWERLSLIDGAFRDRRGLATIDGAFYGEGHEGAAGTFQRNHLRGVFAAVRNVAEE